MSLGVLWRVSVASLAVALLLGQVPAAQAADPALTGTVRNAAGSALSDITVVAATVGAVAQSVVPGIDGSYRIDVPAGTYSLPFIPPSSEYTSLSSLPMLLPRNWPLDVVLTAPTEGSVFLTGRVIADNGTVPVRDGRLPSVGTAIPGGSSGGNSADDADDRAHH